MRNSFSHKIKVYYEDTDAGGVVYYANYLKFIERARSEALSDIGLSNVKIKKDFGAFIEFMTGKDGLLHISEIKWERVESMDGVLEEGEEIKVKLIEVDRRTGKFRLSRKALIPKPEK